MWGVVSDLQWLIAQITKTMQCRLKMFVVVEETPNRVNVKLARTANCIEYNTFKNRNLNIKQNARHECVLSLYGLYE